LKTILITGATDGIGKALAQHYHNKGAQLILIGRRSLDQLEDPLFLQQTYCQTDLAQSDCAEKIVSYLKQKNITTLDLVIHNAGVGYYGPITKQTASNIQSLLSVNLLAPLKLSHALYPHLHKVRGKLVFIGSIAHALPAPDYAVYAASKAALNALGQNLRIEWQGRIAVQVIHPGATKTGMHQKMGIDQTIMDWTKFPPADQVAKQILRAINSTHPVATIGLGNTLATFAGKYLSTIIDTLMQKSRK